MSPWAETFDSFARSIRSQALIVAPFITEQPLQRLASLLTSSSSPQIELLTNLAVNSLLQGSVDSKAIATFCKEIPTTRVRHLPGLHAKAYIADEHTAIITSGNLTRGSLHSNYEYGVQITNPDQVRVIARDLREYGRLGTEVSLTELGQLAEISETLRDRHARTLSSARASIRQEFETQLEVAHETLRQLRGKPGETTNSIFTRTILYILRNGPIATRDIHPIIQGMHPDLCDDSADRVINGIHFGKEWKHRVRGAQVDLRRKSSIELVDGKWRLIQKS